MSREIKLRAWEKLEKKMFDVKSIHFENCVVREKSLTFYEINDIELMQYTGLKDKKGTEIYDQDLLSRDGNVFKVMWSNEFSAWCYVYYLGDCRERPITRIGLNECEIVGNWYENSELVIM